MYFYIFCGFYFVFNLYICCFCVVFAIQVVDKAEKTRHNGIYMTKKGLQTCLNLILIFTPLQADMPVVTPPKKRCGVEILYGIELNISDKNGAVDLDDEVLMGLDYAIISMHQPTFKSGSASENTFAYVNAMKHPRVKIVGHPEDAKFPVDFEALIVAAKHYGVAIEINNSSLSPEGYRGDVRENVRTILLLCKKYECPVVLSSDSHGDKHVGDFTYALEMIRKCGFSESFILNYSLDRFRKFIEKK